jgi:asparagine synthase (glutamine-hydrolysing)
MCGIAGYFCPAGTQPETPDMAAMRRVMRHRGPDGEGTYAAQHGRYSVSFVRLAIIDLVTGDQPLLDPLGGRVLAGNGEIYNYLELRARPDTAGYPYRTQGDMEVVLALSATKGERYVDDLNGMYALALYDERGHTLQLVRDRLGVKPLYWARTRAGGLVFASEIKAVFASGLIPRQVDELAVTRYLRHGYVPGPETLFSGVQKVMPGERIWVSSDGAIEIETYWQPAPADDLPADPEEAGAYLLAQLEDSVRLQLRADVPLGVLLSGGLDAGLVVALAQRHTKHKLATYTVRFEGSPVDETPLAAEVAERYGTDHHVIDLPAADVGDHLAGLAWYCDEPQNDPALLPNALIEKELGKDLKVALNGTGGDELFAGYGRYFQLPVERRYLQLPAFLRAGLIEPVAEQLDPFTAFRLRRAKLWDTAPGAYLHAHSTLFPEPMLRLIGHVPRDDRQFQDDHAQLVPMPKQTAMLYADIKTYLAENLLVLLDRTSMAFGVEGRVPFLDHRLVEAALAVPPGIRTPDNRQKGLEREMAAELLPETVLNASKRGFAAPANTWAEAGLAATAERLLTRPKSLARGWWSAAGIRKLAARPQRFGFQLYALTMLELTVRLHVEEPLDRAPEGVSLADIADAQSAI